MAQTHQEELVAKVTAHVNQHFSGNWRAAFDGYDTDHNGFVSAGELRAFLAAAGVGNLLSRGLWVSGVMREVDANGDAQISWAEFAALLKPEDVSETGPNRVIS